MLIHDEHDLLLPYLNGALPVEDVAALEGRLKVEPDLADALIVLAREEFILTEWAHSSAEPIPIRAAPRRWHFHVVARWSAAAAAVALVVWGAFQLTGGGDKTAMSEAVVVETARGDVTLETADGDVVVAEGQQVLPGQGVRTGGDDSFAVLRYPDNTRFHLGTSTIVHVLFPDGALKGRPGKRIYIDEGQLTADVAHPMLLESPHAEVRSNAGRFNCSSASAATRVESEQGQVRFTRTSDGTSINVLTGFYAVATDQPAGLENPFTPRSLAVPLTQPRATLPNAVGSMLALALSPDGRTLVTGSNEGALKFWDVHSNTLRSAIQAYPGAIRHLEYSSDGRLLLTTGNDRRPKVFDAETGAEKLALRKHRADVDSAAFAPNARSFATVFNNNKDGGEVRFWLTATGREIGAQHLPGTQILALALSADGATLALGCRDGSVRLWQVEAVPDSDRVIVQERLILRGHAGEVRSVAFSARGLVASAGVDGTARLWRVTDGRELHVLTAHARPVRSVAFSDDGRFLVTAGNDSAARLWQVATGREMLTVKMRRNAITRALLSSDGKTVITVGMDRAVRFWDLEQERRAADAAPLPRGLAVVLR